MRGPRMAAYNHHFFVGLVRFQRRTAKKETPTVFFSCLNVHLGKLKTNKQGCIRLNAVIHLKVALKRIHAKW